jgi:hypothetical protein
MKKSLLLIVSIFTLSQVNAQIQYSSNTDSKSTIERATVDKLSGPRVGITLMTNGGLTEGIEEEFGVSTNFITQFGYQFEKQIAGNGQIAGLIEGIVMIGGLDKGLFLPSVSGLFGARTASGFEFAMGPNLSFAGAALVIGFGKTIQAGNLNIPINFAWVPSVTRTETDDIFEEGDIVETIQTTESTGHRFTVTIGFNFRK